MKLHRPKIMRCGSVLPIFLFLVGCSKVEVSLTQPNLDKTVQIRTLSGRAIGTFGSARDSQGRIWIASRKLNVSGVCSRGVDSVQCQNAITGDNFGPPSQCQVDRSVSCNFEAASDGELQLAMVPTAQDGTPVGTSALQIFYIATLPPLPPLILNNNGISYASNYPYVTLRLKLQSEAHSIVSAGVGDLWNFRSGKLFVTSTQLFPAQTKTFSFYAYDLAGNKSSLAQITVSYNQNFALALTQFSGLNSGEPRPSLQQSMLLTNVSMGFSVFAYAGAISALPTLRKNVAEFFEQQEQDFESSIPKGE